MTPPISPPALRLVRLPGEFGPILRCFGELSVATAEALRRDLGLLLPMGHPVLILSLSACRSVDVDGILTVLHTYRELRRKGSRLVVVTGRDRILRLLHFMGIDRIIPLFPTEESAARALRGGGPPEPAPATWETAREETLARWRAIRDLLDDAPEEALLQMTSMFALCERSEEIFGQRPAAAGARCEVCPLFYELGGQSSDVGCRSVLDPIVELVRAGDRETARAQIAELIRTLEEMPLPQEDALPETLSLGGCEAARRVRSIGGV